MGRKRFTAEQIVDKLRQAEVEVAKGMTIGDVCKKLGVQTFFRISGAFAKFSRSPFRISWP